MTLISYNGPRPKDVIAKYGRCLELIPTDKRFNEISVGLYVKNAVFTIWSFSTKPGIEKRIEEIRDLLVSLGGMSPISGTHNQAKFDCGLIHNRPVRFLLSQAVGKDPEYTTSAASMEIKDSKSDLLIRAEGIDKDNIRCYQISATGEARNPAMRLRMIVAGFSKYGEMDKIGDQEVAFECRRNHDGLLRILLPYSRNVSSVETMMQAESMRGQMTTSTLGFSQT
ncbi:MAG: hypothetical protein CL765_08025 [Chloroflexi bacterium]|nr:hypothetical protein [Chloroflexota bacterium]|tara:strand:+ start:4176 stop:4850 length:675 start_codon:yes stop_codon:yes gene_type:complete